MARIAELSCTQWLGRSARVQPGSVGKLRSEDMKQSGASKGQPASQLISQRIAELGDWRGETLSRMRKLIKEADPDVVEEWKWMGTPVWSHDGIICTGESYKNVVKLTFSKGASRHTSFHQRRCAQTISKRFLKRGAKPSWI